MNKDFLNKRSDIIKDLESDGSLMEIAEKYLDDDALVELAEELASSIECLEKAKKVYEENSESFNEDDVEDIYDIAQALDESGDPELQRTASVLDEIILTIGADKKIKGNFKKAQDEEIDKLKKKFNSQINDELYSKADEEKELYINEAIKNIDEKVKKYKPLEASLSTRYSPDMPGVPLVRISDGVWQCPETKKIYDYRAGFTTSKGNVIPGGDVGLQTHLDNLSEGHAMFSTREDILNSR
jgi:hypothetical protein